MTAGANAAANTINAAGGVGGRKIVITSCNSMFQPSTATICAHEAVAAHAIAMVGCENAWGNSGLVVLSAAKVPSLNCPTPGTADVTNPWSFGLVPSDGEDQGFASYECSRPDIHKVGFLAVNVPSEISTFAGYLKVLKACGKTATPVFYPETATDVTPYVQKIVAAKPDFVHCDCFPSQIVQIVQVLEGSGIPASKFVTSSSALTPSALSESAKVLNGVFTMAQFTPYQDTSDPQVAAYLKAMNGSVHTHDTDAEWGYMYVMVIDTAAKQIGASNFNSVTLAKFLSTQNNVPLALSRSVVNPGPSFAPQEKQPWIRIYQWMNGNYNVVPAGPSKDGWVEGWLYP
jgi:ABC-type branched-subunit amino acid transport system substrate-binding protein